MNEFSEPIRYFSLRISIVTVCGLVLGISIKEVTPPAAAARDSLKISPLCVSPGSLK